MEIIDKLKQTPELYFNFLSQLDDQDLRNLCIIDKSIQSYCDADHLWSLKIDKLYPTFPIPKEYNKKKKILYFILKYLDPYDVYSLAIDLGDIRLLDWLFKRYQIKFDRFIRYNFENSIGEGNKRLEKWAKNHNIKLDNIEIANAAAEHKNFLLLNELITQDIYPNFSAWQEALYQGNLDMIKWLNQHNIDSGEEHDTLVLIAAERGHVDLLNYFLTILDIYPDVETANTAAEYGQIKVLNWLTTFEIYPDIRGWNIACSNLQYEVIGWIQFKLDGFKMRIGEPNPVNILDNFIKINNQKNIKRLLDLGYKPSQNVVDETIHIPTLNLLVKYDIYPSGISSRMAETMNYKLLEWLINHNIYPTY